MAWWKSRRLQFAGGSIALFLLLFIVMRAIFYFGFSEVGRSVHPDTNTLLKTLYIGFKFDLRLAILVCLPLLVVSFLPRWNILTSDFIRYLVRVYLAVAVVAVMAFYILDFGHYQYLGVRINSTVLRYADDAAISARMVWESYPVVWILLGWIQTTG